MNATPKKNSGIAWIGEVPASWEFQRLKYKATLAGRIGWQGLTSEEYRDEGVHLVTGTDFEDGRINWNTCVRISNERWAEATQVQLEEGDLLITKDGTVGKVAIVKDLPCKASLNSGIMVIRKRAAISTEFLFWLLQSTVFTGWFNDVNAGASTIAHLYQADFYNFSFYLPPELAEQEQIARALQTQVAKIDQAIDLLQQELDTLVQLKKSMIHEAVTKVSKERVPLNYLFTIIGGNGFAPELQGESSGDLPFIKNSDISSGVARISSAVNYVSRDLARIEGFNIIPKNSILMGKIGESMKKNRRVINTVECCIDNNMQAMVPNEKIIHPEYGLYSLQLLDASDFNNGGPVPSINNIKWKRARVPFPRKHKQLAIVEELDSKCASLDSAMEKKSAQLSMLRKHRESLIFEYVTGKRRVSEVA